MNPESFVLIQDEDCHWYVIPADKQEAASKYFEAVGRYWQPDKPKGARLPKEPEWLVAVGGAPSLVEFTGWTIK